MHALLGCNIAVVAGAAAECREADVDQLVNQGQLWVVRPHLERVEFRRVEQPDESHLFPFVDLDAAMVSAHVEGGGHLHADVPVVELELFFPSLEQSIDVDPLACQTFCS